MRDSYPVDQLIDFALMHEQAMRRDKRANDASPVGLESTCSHDMRGGLAIQIEQWPLLGMRELLVAGTPKPGVIDGNGELARRFDSFPKRGSPKSTPPWLVQSMSPTLCPFSSPRVNFR